MHLLLSNDDGVDAKGICCLADALGQHHDITVVAPDRDRSGTSSALTLNRPVQLKSHALGYYSVDGTPADCVQLGTNGGLDIHPDMVVSGINHGPNLGDDVIYSGTVAAALEGRFLAYPALAMSLVGNTHFDSAAKVALKLLNNIKTLQWPPHSVLNVNVPDVPYEQLQGIKLTRLGQRHQSAPVVDAHNPRGPKSFWIGPIGQVMQGGEGTDFHAVTNHYVSVTVLVTDMALTSPDATLSAWLQTVMP